MLAVTNDSEDILIIKSFQPCVHRLTSDFKEKDLTKIMSLQKQSSDFLFDNMPF